MMQFLVPLKSSSREKPLMTDITCNGLVWRLAAVHNSHMSLQSTISVKLPVAFSALVILRWSSAGVNDFVSGQPSPGREDLSARFARHRPTILSMRPHVHDQRAPFSEGSFTVQATVRFLGRMCQAVGLQRVRLCERPLTDVAGVRPLTSVDPQVTLQQSGCPKPLRTLRTQVRLLTSMNAQVLNEHRVHVEQLPAEAAHMMWLSHVPTHVIVEARLSEELFATCTAENWACRLAGLVRRSGL